MDKLSDEELVGYAFQYCIPFGDGSLGNPKADLLARLAKGRKAIEAMDKISKYLESIPFYDCEGCNKINSIAQDYDKEVSHEQKTN